MLGSDEWGGFVEATATIIGVLVLLGNLATAIFGRRQRLLRLQEVASTCKAIAESDADAGLKERARHTQHEAYRQYVELASARAWRPRGPADVLRLLSSLLIVIVLGWYATFSSAAPEWQVLLYLGLLVLGVALLLMALFFDGRPGASTARAALSTDASGDPPSDGAGDA